MIFFFVSNLSVICTLFFSPLYIYIIYKVEKTKFLLIGVGLIYIYIYTLIPPRNKGENN